MNFQSTEKKNYIFYIPGEKYYSRFIRLIDRMGYGSLLEVTTDLSKAKKYKYFFMPYILHLEHPNLATSDPLLIKVHKIPNSIILYDYSTESVNFESSIKNKFIDLHTILVNDNVDMQRIVFLTANSVLQNYYKKWAEENNLDYLIKVVGFNFYIYEVFCDLANDNWFQENSGKFLEDACLEKKNSSTKKKFFYTSLNLRPRTHRSTIMSYLIANFYLDKGYVSYFGEEFGSLDVSSVNSIFQTKDFITKLNNSEKLLKAYDLLLKKSPIYADKISNEMRDLAYNNLIDGKGYSSYMFPEANKKNNTMRANSYFEIITETWFSDNNNLFFSEKTIRAITRMQFFIFSGCPFSLKYLKSIGYKTFEPFIDESYDLEINPIKRIELINKEIGKLCELSISDIDKLYKNLFPVIEHNYKHFLTKTPEIFSDELNDNFLNILDSFDSLKLIKSRNKFTPVFSSILSKLRKDNFLRDKEVIKFPFKS